METVVLSVDHRRSHGLAQRLFGIRSTTSPTATQRRPGRIEVKRAVPVGQIKAAGGRRYRAVASTAAVDRAGDIVMQDGWQLDSYRNNPVVCWSHDYRALPIGRCTTIGVKNGRLEMEFELAATTFGARCGEMIDAGLLNAVSVGFRPLEWQYLENGSGRRYIKQELLEVSLVPVPANADALIVPPLAQRSARPRLAARAAELARLRA